MLVNFQTILKDADEKGYAVPAFNVYNMETVMGVIQAAEEQRAPVIIQFYSRLATTGFVDYLAPIILKAAEKATVPVCIHLDHGAGFEPAAIALKNGATGIMVDFSKLDMDENIANTKKAVDILSVMNIGVEGEIGHIGAAADGVPTDYNAFETGVANAATKVAKCAPLKTFLKQKYAIPTPNNGTKIVRITTPKNISFLSSFMAENSN
jgi:fructose-bisphosphate aldolase class II